MRKIPLLLWLGFCVNLFAPVTSRGQDGNVIKETTVSAPTRIDWTFAMIPRSLVIPPPDWLGNYQSENQTYQLYVPERVDPQVETGLILFISPTNQAMAVDRWRKVCDELGLILAAPIGAGNDCHPPIRLRIVLDVLDDVRRQYAIDPDRTYVSGFSGGARLACRIAFALPEYFGGVIPIGATGELRNELWLRERVTSRLSVANVIGDKDFNFVEVTKFRGPLFDSSGIRHKTWVVDDMAHAIPQADTLIEAARWLDETLPNRREFAKQYPASRIAGREAPSREQQANDLFKEAELRRQNPATQFSGDMLLKGVAMRWPDLNISKSAMKTITSDRSWQDQEMTIVRDYLIHRSRGLDAYATQETHERYADQKKVRLEAAIMSWSAIVKDGTDDEAIAEATERLIELELMLDELIEAENDK